MRCVVIVVCVALLLGCSRQAPESEKSMVIDGDRQEAIFVEDFEGERETELEVPPEGALPLSVIVETLEKGGYTKIIDAEFADGVWEVEYVVGGEERELHVDPMTGEILPGRPQEADEN